MGGVGSGGPNGGPQYNSANVNGLGGNGTNGDYTGFAYGENKALNESRVAGNAAVSSINMGEAGSTALPNIPSILEPSQLPEQSIMDGAPRGPGANSIPGLPRNPSNDPDIDIIRDQYPIMQIWASMPGTTRATAEVTNYYGTII